VSVSFTSAVVILLHEDVLQLSSDLSNFNPVVDSTVVALRGHSIIFFETLGMFSVASGKRHLDAMRGKLDASCSLSHLR